MTFDLLHRARALELPQREAMLRRDPAVQSFWTENRNLLAGAWVEWEDSDQKRSVSLDSSILDHSLRTAVSDAWQDPTKEGAVRQLLREAAPGVFLFQMFDPERIVDLRDYLEDAWGAGIPIRPPYGIVLNRRGAMLDRRSDGCLNGPSFQAFYQTLIDMYMRPIARMLYPEIMGYDGQTFGFSINYQPDGDTSIRPHSDASAVTLNINANLPGEEFTGSTVDFFDPSAGTTVGLTFEPGTAMIHRGHVPHAAPQITTGERTNLVLWLMGSAGRVPTQVSGSAAVDPNERWAVPNAVQDSYVPF